MRLSLSKLPRPLGTLLFTSFLAFQAGAASLPAGVTEAASIEGITEYRLGNGLRVLLVPDESKPSTTVNMTYLVGSRNENYGQTGMAHLLEHMLFKGTSTTRNAMGEFSRRGLQANGSTSGDRTNYFASFAANPETLKWYLGWQADAMVNSLIAKEDLDSEMTVVRNEMESGENSPSRILMQKMQAAAFQWHSYGKNTIGARSDVENVDIGQLRAFYHQYYQPDNAVLIVAGKFDPQATLADIEETLGKLPKPNARCRGGAGAGRRTLGDAAPRGRPLVAAMYHIPRGQRRLRAAGPGRHHPGRHAFRPPVPRAGADQDGLGRVRLHHGAARSRPGHVRRAAVAGQERGRGAQDADRHARDAGQRSPSPRRNWNARAAVADLVEQVYSDPEQVGVAFRSHRRRRLAPVLPAARPRPQGHAGRCAEGGHVLPGAEQPHRGPLPAHRKTAARAARSAWT